jgi:hypothetical protein
MSIGTTLGLIVGTILSAFILIVFFTIEKPFKK